jgi:hypothetical protein
MVTKDQIYRKFNGHTTSHTAGESGQQMICVALSLNHQIYVCLWKINESGMTD